MQLCQYPISPANINRVPLSHHSNTSLTSVNKASSLISQYPKASFFCYEGNLLDRITNVEKVEQVHGVGGGFYLLTETDNRIAVSGNNGIGAPGVSMLLEMYIELGIKRFINIGIAGGLQKTSQIGDVVVCTNAIRDEGVSYHYLEDPSAPRTAIRKPDRYT